MKIKVNAKQQVTVPAELLEALGAQPGDYVEIERGPADRTILVRLDNGAGHRKPVKIDYSKLAYLHDKIDPNIPPLLDFTPYREGEIDLTPYRD